MAKDCGSRRTASQCRTHAQRLGVEYPQRRKFIHAQRLSVGFETAGEQRWRAEFGEGLHTTEGRDAGTKCSVMPAVLPSDGKASARYLRHDETERQRDKKRRRKKTWGSQMCEKEGKKRWQGSKRKRWRK
eukprot:1856362-Rhodomonas_salina.1